MKISRTFDIWRRRVKKGWDRARRGSRHVEFGDDHLVINDTRSTDGESTHFSSRERQMLIDSWRQSEASDNENTGQRIFRKVFATEPQIAAVFGVDISKQSNLANLFGAEHPAMDKHVRLFMNMLEMAVDKMDHLDDLSQLCQSLGERHAALALDKGFQPHFWVVFERALIECAIEWEHHYDNADTLDQIKALWTRLIDFIIREMKIGFDNGLQIRESMSKSQPTAS